MTESHDTHRAGRPGDEHTGSPPQGPVNALGLDDPMDDERCLFILSLLMDGRSVHPVLAERARAWAADHAQCAQALRDFEAIRVVLRDERELSPGEEFTERVLHERKAGAQSADITPLVRRLSLAAALLLALTLGFELQTPSSAIAGDDLSAQRHSIDELKPDPFGAPQLDAGLRVLFPDATPLSSLDLEAADASEEADH